MILNLFSIDSKPFDLCVPINLQSPVSLIKNNLVFIISSAVWFEKTLIKYKFKIKEKKFFPDHYNFSNKDINEIKSLAKEKRLEIVTSEKDYLRLDNSKKKNIKFIKVDLKISNQKKFEIFLNKNLWKPLFIFLNLF